MTLYIVVCIILKWKVENMFMLILNSTLLILKLCSPKWAIIHDLHFNNHDYYTL